MKFLHNSMFFLRYYFYGLYELVAAPVIIVPLVVNYHLHLKPPGRRSCSVFILQNPIRLAYHLKQISEEIIV
jgi:hypothetical protein